MGFFAILQTVLGFLGGGTVQSITNAIENVSKAKADKEIALGTATTAAERDKALKHYDYQIRALETMMAVMIAEQSWWVTRMIRPTFAYLCAFHFAGVILSSYGWIGTVYALPTPMDWLEVGIIGSYFALRPFEKNQRAEIVSKRLAAQDRTDEK